MVIGAGGIGGHVTLALAAAGVGTIRLFDHDRIDGTNLARQTLFTASDIGASKAQITARRVLAQNPDCKIQAIEARADETSLAEFAAEVDCIIDASDNFATRFAVNRVAVAHAVALVTGSAIRWEGQFAAFGPDYKTSPCYACMYSPDDESLEDCQGAGVLASLPGTIGQCLATETIALLTGKSRPHQLTIWDARHASVAQLKVSKRSSCGVCSPRNTPQR